MPATSKARTRTAKPKVRTFYPLPGKLSEYPRNLTAVLSFIRDHKPSRSEAVQWMTQEYQASREFCRHVLQMLRRTHLLRIVRKQCQLTSEAQEYLKTGDPDVLARTFVAEVEGFKEMLDVLDGGQAMQAAELHSSWRSQIRVPLSQVQFRHRLDWLRGLGYVDTVARHHFLSDRGLRLALELRQMAAEAREKKVEVSHQDLEDKVRVIGEFFEFETRTRPSVNDVLPALALKLTQGDRRLDCLWVRYVPFAGNIRFPIEIQLGGNLADTIDRLETVSEYVQKAIIITDEDQEKEIVDRLKVKKSRLLDKLTIVGVEDVYKAVEAANVLRSLTKRIFAE